MFSCAAATLYIMGSHVQEWWVAAQRHQPAFKRVRGVRRLNKRCSNQKAALKAASEDQVVSAQDCLWIKCFLMLIKCFLWMLFLKYFGLLTG